MTESKSAARRHRLTERFLASSKQQLTKSFMELARKETGHKPRCFCRDCKEMAVAIEQDYRESPEEEMYHDAMESLRHDP